MRRNRPDPEEIFEELADRAALQIDRSAPVAFDAALDELMRYHRFLLNVNASKTPDGEPFNYAAVPGDMWPAAAPHQQWISQYRRLFERAASRISEDPDFIHKLAYVPIHLLPRRGDPEMMNDVLEAIIDLGRILIHQLESWVTRRTVVETAAGSAASPRMLLAGSDAKSYANLLPNIVGAWEGLLQTMPSVFRWKDDRHRPDNERWDALRASWSSLWRHLHNSAYMLTVSVWNEDEIGVAFFRDMLVRWSDMLSHHFNDRAYFREHRLLFPDIVLLDWATAQERISFILPEYIAAPGPDELFNTLLHEVHDDVVLTTAALLLLWSMDQKQVSDIGARTAIALIDRELEDSDDELRQPARDKSFSSLLMHIIRIEIANDRSSKTGHGANLDRLVESLDNMTERRVVPGRVFTPSTLHRRDELQGGFLAMLLAKAPEHENALSQRIQDLAKSENALPDADRSLRDILRRLNSFLELLANPPTGIQRGLALIDSTADFTVAAERVGTCFTSVVQLIEAERTKRLRARPIGSGALDELRDAAERILLTPSGEVPFFRGFSIRKGSNDDSAEYFTFRLNGVRKAEIVDPPMETTTVGPTFYAREVTKSAGNRTWGLFTQQAREIVAVPHRIDDPAFWERIRVLAADVGAEPLLLVSRRAEGRILNELMRRNRDQPVALQIERQRREEVDRFYIATVEDVDVYAADFDSGKAWLFSPYILQSLQYRIIDDDQRVVRVTFRPGEDLTGALVAEFKLHAEWADWPIYEIHFESPAAQVT